MAIVLSDNVKINAPKPVESKYLNITAPYVNTTEVNSSIAAGERYTGLTVNILGVEYWYKDGIGDGDIVLKQFAGGDTNNIYSKEIVTGSTVLTTGSSYVILVNAASAAVITLPATPIDGQVFIIKDVSGNALTNNITIDGNSNSIESNGDATINTNYGALEFMYDATLDWMILSFVN